MMIYLKFLECTKAKRVFIKQKVNYFKKKKLI